MNKSEKTKKESPPWVSYRDANFKHLKTYKDYGYVELNDDVSKVKWTKYKIVVPTEEDKKEVMGALEYLHWSDIDTDIVTVNQLVHEYDHDGSHPGIVVDKKLYDKLSKNN